MAGVSGPTRGAWSANPWLVGALSGAVTAALIPGCARVARRLGVVDRPGVLKPQESEVPYLGGVAVTLGMAGAAVGTANAPALVAPLLAVTVGLADDIRGLPPGLRLAAEAAAGVAVGAGRCRWRKVAAAAGTMVLANAVNMVDGADGIAGAVTLASAAGFAALLRGQDRLVASALAGSVTGFLIFNRAPARIYLGDAGSYVIGTCTTQLLMSAWEEGSGPGLAACVLVGYPLIELGTTVLRRWRGGQRLMHGDRGHIYDRLMGAGWSATRTALALGGLQGAAAVVAVALAGGRWPWRHPAAAPGS